MQWNLMDASTDRIMNAIYERQLDDAMERDYYNRYDGESLFYDEEDDNDNYDLF